MVGAIKLCRDRASVDRRDRRVGARGSPHRSADPLHWSRTAYSLTRRRRLEQHLAPAVVRRIVEQPDLVKLNGEWREVSALFTDIEGFTATTHRAGAPRIWWQRSTCIFEGVAGIVINHGGMIDKIVGDAVHALFNAPLDLEDHPQRAVECAIAIQTWSEDFRRRAPAAAIELGRTRIGIETGLAIVGDVGIRSKLDYTAHGDAVNMAARLEACAPVSNVSAQRSMISQKRRPAELSRPGT